MAERLGVLVLQIVNSDTFSFQPPRGSRGHSVSERGSVSAGVSFSLSLLSLSLTLSYNPSTRLLPGRLVFFSSRSFTLTHTHSLSSPVVYFSGCRICFRPQLGYPGIQSTYGRRKPCCCCCPCPCPAHPPEPKAVRLSLSLPSSPSIQFSPVSQKTPVIRGARACTVCRQAKARLLLLFLFLFTINLPLHARSVPSDEVHLLLERPTLPALPKIKHRVRPAATTTTLLNSPHRLFALTGAYSRNTVEVASPVPGMQPNSFQRSWSPCLPDSFICICSAPIKAVRSVKDAQEA